ncbi:E3 ISG15--protein ligase HERC5-like isoform X2 [Argiope bruennichi]|uniref:E3 ISG15--protein ligase HERC5-like isoform X2 n=1 Tax=Argiope bruennichi TaxID=94029 RepID=UPI002494D059|nr:E3 ISG15--protein ligase HERC5-like isoform X2 [Argiope bruennichi]
MKILKNLRSDMDTEDNLFFYFGIKTYKDEDVDVLTPALGSNSYTQCFSHLQLPSKCKVIDVFLGWINLIFYTSKNVFKDLEVHKTIKDNKQEFNFANELNEAFYRITHCPSESEEHSKEAFSSIKHMGINNISIGLNYTFLTTSDGRCYFYFNKNIFSEPVDLTPSILRTKNVITEDLYSVILAEDGKVFKFKYEEKPCLEELIVPVPIKEIACGKEHVLLLSEFGTVFSYGFGSHGQLGLGNIGNQETPELVEALNGLKIISISAGGWHSAAISESGDLYMWGWNESGQLGFPCNKLQNGERPKEEIETICCLPKIVDLDDETVVAVSCGSRHTVALTVSLSPTCFRNQESLPLKKNFIQV